MTFDKTELQIFANYCTAAAESMAFTLMRTSHSTFVKETEDFSCMIMTPKGLTVASPKTLGATWYVGLDFGAVIGMIDSYEPGDICMTNDAYSGYVSNHTPDMMMWKPVFHNGEILCFVGGHIHNTDMGGAVPASLSRSLTEIQQEGIRFPPTKVVRRGALNEELMALMVANVRAPDQNRGDMKAQIASLVTGERRVLEIVERFGAESFKLGIEALLDYSEAQARKIVRGIPDGEYFFAEYADEDSVDGKPMRIALTLRVAGDSLLFDFTGSDPQLTSSLNVPTGGHERHVLPLVGMNYVLYSLNPDLLLNAGMLRVARCVLPLGSVMNPIAPAAVGMRSLTCFVVQVVTFGAFAQALPDEMPACPSAAVSVLNVRTMDRAGRTLMASIGPVGGGAGGSAFEDGSEASGANMAFLRNTPVEINESEVPIRILRYGLVPGSGGPGRTRGGLGAVMEFKVFSPNTLVTARNRDRSVFGAWGVRGGRPGKTSTFVRNPGTAGAIDLGNCDLVNCDPGDVLRLEGGGGGGYGHPFQRDPAKVLEDWRCGYVSREDAREIYAVAIAGGAIDSEATRALRVCAADMAATRQVPAFDYGAGRDAHEERWTRERYAVLSARLDAVPVSWRFFLKHRMFDKLDARYEAGSAVPGARIIDELFDELIGEYAELRDQAVAAGEAAGR
jgi:N-methylhydantoinase B